MHTISSKQDHITIIITSDNNFDNEISNKFQKKSLKYIIII
jgi:hypothetical protein